jgi:hypothetical protein
VLGRRAEDGAFDAARPVLRADDAGRRAGGGVIATSSSCGGSARDEEEEEEDETRIERRKTSLEASIGGE